MSAEIVKIGAGNHELIDILETALVSERDLHPNVLNLKAANPSNRELLGGKAANLALLIQAGMPVPAGFCITTEAYDQYLKEGAVAHDLVQTISLLKRGLGGRVALRSSATCEDGSVLSMAGVFTSLYLQEDDDILEAMKKIYDHAQSPELKDYMRLQGIDPETVKMALVLQRLIEPISAGVVYTGVNGRDLLIQYVDGFGSKLVDGEDTGAGVILDISGQIKDAHKHKDSLLPQKALVNIADLSRKIEVLFDGKNQDIEFAYQDGDVFILQSRPLTTRMENIGFIETVEDTLEATKEKLRALVAQEKQALGTDQVIFSDSNYSELLPHPTEMDFGIFAYIFSGSDGVPGGIQLGRREMGYQINDKEIEYTHFIGGKPYFSIAMDALTFYAGFPATEREYLDTLVKEYLEVIQNNPSRGSYPEMYLYLQDPAIEDLERRYGSGAQRHLQTYKDFLKRMEGFSDRFQDDFRERELPEIERFIQGMGDVDLSKLSELELVEYITTVLEHLRTISCVDFVKTARLGFYYSQRLQNELIQMFGKEEYKLISAKLNQGLDGSRITEVNIAIEEAESDEEAYQIGKGLIGHFSTQEMLEIRHPLNKDDEQAFRRYIDSIRKSGDYAKGFKTQREERLKAEKELLGLYPKKRRKEIEKIMKSAQIYMALRETVKYHFTREYALIRDALVVLNDRLGFEKDDIFFVYPRELSRTADDPQSMFYIISERKRSFDNYPKLNLPKVIREEDIETLGSTDESDGEIAEFNGKFLAAGESFEGIIVNLDEIGNKEDIGRIIHELNIQGKRVVLVARQMNLSHDPYIALASGLIIENAGFVSHGAQRARELGRGALAGIKSKYLKTGTAVYFDPTSYTVRKISQQ